MTLEQAYLARSDQPLHANLKLSARHCFCVFTEALCVFTNATFKTVWGDKEFCHYHVPLADEQHGQALLT